MCVSTFESSVRHSRRIGSTIVGQTKHQFISRRSFRLIVLNNEINIKIILFIFSMNSAVMTGVCVPTWIIRNEFKFNLIKHLNIYNVLTVLKKWKYQLIIDNCRVMLNEWKHTMQIVGHQIEPVDIFANLVDFVGLVDGISRSGDGSGQQEPLLTGFFRLLFERLA